MSASMVTEPAARLRGPSPQMRAGKDRTTGKRDIEWLRSVAEDRPALGCQLDSNRAGAAVGQ